jgi:signal transduction histidine kinase
MADDRTKLDGKYTHTIDFETLDDATRERLMACIKERGKISVVLRPIANVDLSGLHAAYTQLID